jgi:serine phosphatase RsbU (regulator of sigma subunit)
MFKVAIGQGEDVDTRSAINRAVSRCKRQLQDLSPQAGILFSGVDFNHELVLKEIGRAFPNIDLVGCTTGGEFSSDYGFSDDSINLVLFASDSIKIGAGIGEKISIDPIGAAESAVRQARKNLSGTEKLCLVFPDGMTGSPNAIVRSLSQILPPSCPVFGGVPSRHYEIPAPTLQFFNNTVLEDAVPLLLFSGNLNYTFAISNSWRPIGVKEKVTESSGYEVRRIGQMRALDFYRYYLGKHRHPALEFPLAVYAKDQERFFIRSPSDYDERRGSIFFSGPIASETVVQLTEVTRNRVIADTENSVTSITNTLHKNWRPSLALAFSCATRKAILGTRTKEELQILEKSSPDGLPICGFYTFGELAPLRQNDESRLHNCTLVTLLIGEKDYGSDEHSSRIESVIEPSEKNEPTMSMARLKGENRFLLKKLNRSEYYRERLERNKDLTDVLLRKINRDVKRAHLEIKRKNSLLRKSLALANEIQVNLLPQRMPENDRLDIAGRSIYCSATGGDYYDFISIPNADSRRLDFVVGDVTGHGIEAALLMTTARALLRSRVQQPGSLAQVITDVNIHLTNDLYESGRFMTLFYLSIDPSSGQLAWVRAGHDPAILYHPEAEHFEELRGIGMALGVDRSWQYVENTKSELSPGQILFIGTDGIWETRNPQGKMFGKKNVYDMLKKNASLKAADIIGRMINKLDEYRGGQEPEDDITLMVIKIL